MKARTPLVLAASLALVLAIPAGAELSQKGDLFVSFDGGITPLVLPRAERVPISVRLEGRIKALSPADAPGLKRIRIALNRAGRLSTVGLPRCHRGQIDRATPTRALAACGPALVGGGGYTVKTMIEGQRRTIAPGEVLLFNGREHGHATILALLYETEPAPAGHFLVFHIRHTGGVFGTVLTADIPFGTSSNAYLRSIFLQLQRRYEFGGRERSYLSASCAAPAGIYVASFPFAKASMTFDDGRTLSSTMERSCRVKR